VFPLAQLTLEDLLGEVFDTKDVDLEGSKLLDVHAFVVGNSKYEQKVYRLKNGSIYTTTKQVEDEGLKFLQRQLDEAVKDQRFEDAVLLRDKIAKEKETK
jgi:protein-arginine kinase activator protein McsA